MKVWEVRLSSNRASKIGASVGFQDEKLQAGKNMGKQTGQLQERPGRKEFWKIKEAWKHSK